MTCASCGRQVAAGARYCVHCGAEQSVPTPIAAVAAASIARTGAREAANAAHAEPARGSAAGGSGVSSSRPVASVAAFPHNGATGPLAAREDAGARPAYADAPRRRGLAAVIIAGCVAVAIAVVALVAWRIGGERSEATAAGETATVAQNVPSAPAETGPDAQAPGTSSPGAQSQAATAPGASSLAAASPADAGTGESGSSSAPQAPPATSNAPASPSRDVPVEIKVLPPHASTAPAAHRAPAPKASAGATASPAEAPASPQANPSPPGTTVAAAASTGASHPVDRWQRMNDELSRCTREDFIARVICGQRVRFRYCDGYWGKAAACPGNPTPERGQ